MYATNPLLVASDQGALQVREIKFRAWVDGKMIPVSNLDMDSDEPLVNGDDLNRFPCAWIEEPNALMQYTGLKDRNGVEIYEGDILRDVDSGWSGDIGYVKYNPVYFAFYQKTEVDGSELETHFDYRGQAYEVIGNVYENPELIND